MPDERFARCDRESAQAPQPSLVQQIQDHARKAHGLVITKKEALDQARPVERR